MCIVLLRLKGGPVFGPEDLTSPPRAPRHSHSAACSPRFHCSGGGVRERVRLCRALPTQRTM